MCDQFLPRRHREKYSGSHFIFPCKEKVLSEEYLFLSYRTENGCVAIVLVIVAAILEIERMASYRNAGPEP